jgi:hypothetical protein
MLRKGSCDMHHALFMLRSIKSETALIRELHNALAKAGHIAMTKDAPNSFNKPILATIALHILVRHELHQCLSNRKTDRSTHSSMILNRRNSIDSRSTFPGRTFDYISIRKILEMPAVSKNFWKQIRFR